MRPIGEIRLALLDAARALWAERGQGVTWRELALRARVGYAAAKQAVKDMARAGDLVRVGSVNVTGSRRPMTVYKPAARRMPGARLDVLLSTGLSTTE